MSLNIPHKSILINLMVIIAIFITIYSTVFYAILTLLVINLPSTPSYLAWVPNLHIIVLNILIIGIGLLIGSLIFKHFYHSRDLAQKIKDQIRGGNLRKYRILMKSGSFFGALLVLYMFGYFISFIIFFNIYNFSAVEIASLFLIPLVICFFFFQCGIFIFFIGFYFYKKFIKSHNSDNNSRTSSFLSRGNRILTSGGIIYSSILIFIFGWTLDWIFAFHWNWFIGSYPPGPYTWEYMSFILGILSIFVFILIYGIQYYFRLNWYVKQHNEITRMKFNLSKKFIAPIFIIISLIVMFLPFPPYFYIISGITFIISEAWLMSWWDIYLNYSLIFFSILIIIIGVTIILSPRRKYELLKKVEN
ncbi:MAG: hypothetical protein ACFFA7_16615 [Promethearchaeota archaeon]